MKYLILSILMLVSLLFADFTVKLDTAECHEFKGVYNAKGCKVSISSYVLTVTESEAYISIKTNIKGILFIKMKENHKIKGYKGVSK